MCKSLTAGLVNLPKAVLTSLDRALLSGTVKVRVTRPRAQISRGVNSSTSYSISSTSNAASRDVHFCRLFSLEIYSVSSLLQVYWSLCFICVHAEFFDVSVSLKKAPGTLQKDLPSKNWFGVSGLSSSWWLLTWVSGRELTRHSALLTIVVKTSGVSFVEPRFKRSSRLTDWTTLSHNLTKWGAEGG